MGLMILASRLRKLLTFSGTGPPRPVAAHRQAADHPWPRSRLEVMPDVVRDVPDQQILIPLLVQPSRWLPVQIAAGAAVRQDHDNRKLADVSDEVGPLDPPVLVVAEPVQLHQDRIGTRAHVGRDRVVPRPLAQRIIEQSGVYDRLERYAKVVPIWHT